MKSPHSAYKRIHAKCTLLVLQDLMYIPIAIVF